MVSKEGGSCCSSIRKSGRPRDFHPFGLPDSSSFAHCFYTASFSRLILDQLLGVGLSIFDDAHEVEPGRKSRDRDLEGRLIRLERSQHRQPAPKLDFIRARSAHCRGRAWGAMFAVRLRQLQRHHIHGRVGGEGEILSSYNRSTKFVISSFSTLLPMCDV